MSGLSSGPQHSPTDQRVEGDDLGIRPEGSLLGAGLLVGVALLVGGLTWLLLDTGDEAELATTAPSGVKATAVEPSTTTAPTTSTTSTSTTSTTEPPPPTTQPPPSAVITPPTASLRPGESVELEVATANSESYVVLADGSDARIAQDGESLLFSCVAVTRPGPDGALVSYVEVYRAPADAAGLQIAAVVDALPPGSPVPGLAVGTVVRGFGVVVTNAAGVEVREGFTVTCTA